ncbi:protein phosphatase 2C family protein [Aspergillus bombycis]|uniref:protein-serine/threonine phosphatase n=1 Tax=Aspergillus bombycis TaxID=109264 RepID=A0A1F7ZME7_9EURO|nr:protein phosphatase 2C family protein [Aspergillus bombycis]OGM40288.1 protein phosphatase 2C family protein [Aspergillus bombycis]
MSTTTRTIPSTITIEGAGAASAIGSRPTQQDQYTFLLPENFLTNSDDKIAFFAVYDGHGSSKVSKHANENIQRFLQESPELESGRYEEAIQEALKKEEAALLKGFRAGEEKFATSGSTAALALVNLTQGVLVVGNLGDSHILMADYTGASEGATDIRRITKAHKPGDPDEKNRIMDAGGVVNTDTGTERLGALNMSRALGDLQYKEPLINSGTGPLNEPQRRADITFSTEQQSLLSSEPYLTRVNLNDGGQHVLILTSDGVTNGLEDEIIVHGLLTCYRSGLNATESAKYIVDEAADVPGSDNATCIAVFIGGRS